MVSLRAVIVALALGIASANSPKAPTRNFSPVASISVGHANIASGLSVDALQAEVSLESEVSDELTVGLSYDHAESSGANPIKSVFARLSQKMAGGDVDADVEMNMASNSLEGDVTYGRDGNKVVAHVNSASDSPTPVETVSLSRDSFKATYTTASGNLDVEAGVDLDADTSLLVSMSQGDNSASVEVNRHLDADTDVQVNLTPGAENLGANVEVTRRLDADNTVKPKFDITSKKLTCAWVRKLDAGRTATVDIDPDNSVDVSVDADSKADWSGKISAPWGNPGDADISVSRQFTF